jgi:hypothetical protein
MVPTAVPPTVAVITEFSGALPDQGLTWNVRERSGGVPQAASATHRLVEPHPTGLQVVVCWRWVAKQPPAPQEPLVQVPQVQAVQLASATHRLVEPHPTGLQVVVCWRWVAKQPPAAQEPLVQVPQAQAGG